MPEPSPQEPHAVPIIADMGKLWPAIGWTLFAIGLAGGIARIAAPPFEPAKGDVPIRLVDSPLALPIIAIAILGAANAILWVLFDLLDRRGRLSWIVPMLIFGLCGLYALPLGVYLFLRKELRPVS